MALDIPLFDNIGRPIQIANPYALDVAMGNISGSYAVKKSIGGITWH